MGWLRTIFLGDIGNRLDLDDVEQSLARSRREQRDKHWELAKRFDQLERENDQLKLCIAALCRALASRGVVRLDELRSLMAQIDSEDGDDDGRMKGPIL